MSWKEFKKKKEQEEANDTNTSSTTNNNTSQMTSWQKFKKEKEQKKLQSNTITKSKDEEQKNTIWEEIGNFADGAGKVVDNLWQGMKNGIMSLQQTVGRNMYNLQGREKEAETWDKINQRLLESTTKGLSEQEKKQIYTEIENNPLNYSNMQRNLISNIEEKKQGLQEKKNLNVSKIQENAESINNPIGKYIAGEIAPRYRTNVTRYDWWSDRNNIFYRFSNRKLL